MNWIIKHIIIATSLFIIGVLLLTVIVIIMQTNYLPNESPILDKCASLEPDDNDSQYVYEYKAIRYVRCLANG